MPLDRFYLPGEWQDDLLTLVDSEAHHLLHVLRKRPGDRIEIFDGQGRRATAEIISTDRKTARVRIDGLPASWAGSCGSGVWIAVAPPRGERLRWMIEKLTELNVERILLLQTERTLPRSSEQRKEKLLQFAIAACKQCGRDHLPEMIPSLSLDDCLFENATGRRKFLADPEGIPILQASGLPFAETLCFVGPEGGFTDNERRRLIEQGATSIALGPYRLRIETAAMVAAVWLVSSVALPSE